MKTMDEEGRNALRATARRVADFREQGDSLRQALVKGASKSNLTPEQTRRLCEMVNIGNVLPVLDRDSLQDKLASVEVVRAGDVVEEVFGDRHAMSSQAEQEAKSKYAKDEDYLSLLNREKPDLSKAASGSEDEPRYKRACRAKDSCNLLRDEAEKLASLRSRTISEAIDLERALQKAAKTLDGSEDMKDLEERLSARAGRVKAAALFDWLEDRVDVEKRADLSDPDNTVFLTDFSETPARELKEACDQMDAVLEKVQEKKAQKDTILNCVEELQSKGDCPTPEWFRVHDYLGVDKVAELVDVSQDEREDNDDIFSGPVKKASGDSDLFNRDKEAARPSGQRIRDFKRWMDIVAPEEDTGSGGQQSRPNPGLGSSKDVERLFRRSAEDQKDTGDDKDDKDDDGKSRAEGFFSGAGAGYKATQATIGGASESGKKGVQGLRDLIRRSMPSNAEEEEPDVEDVFTPKHQSEKLHIQAEALLNNLLTNDPILSDRDPDEVIENYNRIRSIRPNIIKQPHLVRSLLRQMSERSDALEPSLITELEEEGGEQND